MSEPDLPILEDESRVCVFIPGRLAALCGDCDGIFVASWGRCPGCGSSEWMLFPTVERHNAESVKDAA